MAQRYQELIPNPDVVELEDIGHFPLIEAPQAVLRHFLAFLGEKRKGDCLKGLARNDSPNLARVCQSSDRFITRDLYILKPVAVYGFHVKHGMTFRPPI